MNKIKISFTAFVLLLLISNQIIFGQVPVISSFSPTSGVPGTVVNIYGNYFVLDGGGDLPKPPANFTTVKIGDLYAYPTSVTATRIVVPIPERTPGSYKIYIRNANGETESTGYLTILPPPPPPITNVAYLHGFNSNSTTWTSAELLFRNEFNEDHSTNVSYNGLASISQTATSSHSSLVPYANTVVVAHSMGGVLAREIKRQQGTNCNMKALITIGTPHQAAPIAELANENFAGVTALWIDDLAQPWLAFGSANEAFDFAISILTPVLDYAVDFFDPFYTLTPAGVDLKPGSAFMNTLNSNPTSTLPEPVYTIYGHEDWYSHIRLADAALNESPENGAYVNTFMDVIDYYALNAWASYNDASFYYDEYLANRFYDPEYAYWCYDMFIYWTYIASQFNAAAYAMNVFHQSEWNQFIVGETLTGLQVDERNCVNDAFIPRWSQTPNFVAGERHLVALHTNHAEESKTNEAIEQIRDALTRDDINLPR